MNSIYKICFIDLDGTLIKTKSGKIFPTHKFDWIIKGNTRSYVSGLRDRGYKVILVTNQGGISRGIVKRDEFEDKLRRIQLGLGFEFDNIFIADSMKSEYRKPKTKALTKDLLNLNIDIDRPRSIMIGDAGGREGDFSDSDKKFAENLGIKFIHVDDIIKKTALLP